MDLLKLIKYRRSIRKYQAKPIPYEDTEKIIEAGLYAPNAGGGQRSIIVGIRNPELLSEIGRFNVACFDRTKLSGNYVSADQPSIIDDPTIQSGFYGAPTVCVIFRILSAGILFCASDCQTGNENRLCLRVRITVSENSS